MKRACKAHFEISFSYVRHACVRPVTERGVLSTARQNNKSFFEVQPNNLLKKTNSGNYHHIIVTFPTADSKEVLYGYVI